MTLFISYKYNRKIKLDAGYNPPRKYFKDNTYDNNLDLQTKELTRVANMNRLKEQPE